MHGLLPIIFAKKTVISATLSPPPCSKNRSFFLVLIRGPETAVTDDERLSKLLKFMILKLHITYLVLVIDFQQEKEKSWQKLFLEDSIFQKFSIGMSVFP